MCLAKVFALERIERLHVGNARINGILAKLQLKRNFDRTTDQYHPERDKARFGSQRGGGDEFTGTHNGGR